MTRRDENSSAVRGGTTLLLVALAGSLVATALGMYARLHTPTGRPLALIMGFSGMATMKAWLATAGALLGVLQLQSVLWMWGRLPFAGAPPAWVALCHRWCGTLAFLVTLPVAYHCLWSLGFATSGTRAVLHSLFGCAFYGAFATKMLALRVRGLPGWALPLVGGVLFALLIAAWASSSLWYFSQPGLPLL
ncbi:DUF6529 family protein [Streptomyces cinereoruber]|uniref:DUF6529 family protein n=1 Tax=Streptomyces cinereoruber TaxID=67260 RepID=UPI0036269C58